MLLWIIFCTGIIEIFTLTSRIFFGPASRFYSLHFHGIHIHHLYVGIILLILSLFFPFTSILVLGWSLVLSDVVHHFLILPLLGLPIEFP